MLMKICFIFLAGCLQLSSQYWCWHWSSYGHLWNGPNTQTISVGESVSFNCYGEGSHLYWFIDGINTVNMSSQEISDRGLSVGGWYNHYPPYYSYNCLIQFSVLTMSGNCLNNNTEVYCVILGIYSPSDGGGNRTSSVANLTVKGDPTVISQFTAFQTTIDSLLMYWEIKTVSNGNYTQTITIEEDKTTIYSVKLEKHWGHQYQYISKTAFKSCMQYNITLRIDTNCSVDLLSEVKYLTGKPLQPLNVSLFKKEWTQKYLIQFQFNSSMYQCQHSLPSTIEVNLNRHNGDLISSDLIPWDNVMTLSDGYYEIEFNNEVIRDNTNYYLLIASQSEYGQTVSEPYTISTFDVIDVQYSFTNDTAEFCVTCMFVKDSQAIGCVAVLFMTTNIYSMKIARNTFSNNGSRDCVTIADSGLYSISVYDWEGNGDDILNNEPAVKTVMYLHVTVNEAVVTVNEAVSTESSQGYTSIIRLQTSSTSVYIVHSTAVHIVNTTSDHLFTQTAIDSQEQQANSDSMVVVFGTLFVISLLLLSVIIIALLISVMVRQRKTLSSTGDDRTNTTNDNTTMQMNSAYELVNIQQQDSSLTVKIMAVDRDYTTDVYENVVTDHDERYQFSHTPTEDTHTYDNVQYK